MAKSLAGPEGRLASDPRNDGRYVVAVRTTGIYCRPSDRAARPKPENTTIYPTAAAAERAGYRACKRCRPDRAPHSPAWQERSDVVARAVRLIMDGVVDREGVGGLSRRLGYSTRQLGRLLVKDVGAGPLALARTQRTQTARALLETTSLSITEVAFASGFSSIRQFNEAVRAACDLTPSEIRKGVRSHRSRGGAITLNLPCREPLDFASLLAFFEFRSVPGVETVAGATYRRGMSLPFGPGVVSVSRPSGAKGYVACDLELTDLRDVPAAAGRVRRLFDLDADPLTVTEHLATCPVIGPLAVAAPGRRLPGTVDPGEMAIRAVIGQQISVRAAGRLAGQLAERYGRALPVPRHGLTHAFPTPSEIAAIDPDELPMPRTRAMALVTLARAIARGELVLDAGADRQAAEEKLLALSGIGPWTADYIRLRALCDPDAFLSGDLGVRKALAALGQPTDEKSARALAERWRPYRAYAVMHLWASLKEVPEGPRREE